MVKTPPVNVGDIRDRRFDPWVGKIPWRRAEQPPPVFLPRESHGGAWRAMVHKVAKNQTQLKQPGMHTRMHTYISQVYVCKKKSL